MLLHPVAYNAVKREEIRSEMWRGIPFKLSPGEKTSAFFIIYSPPISNSHHIASNVILITE
jgi:hypothetical protein